MGGFFAGLGAALAGAGAQAGPYRDKENEHKFKAWETGKQELIKSIDDLALRATDHTIRSRLDKLRAKVSSSLPSDEISKHLTEFQELSTMHPSTAQMFEPPPVKTGPGPAAPGSVPGSPQIQPPMPNKQDAASQTAVPLAGLLAGGAGWNGTPEPKPQPQPESAAQPTSSPVQGGPMADISMPQAAPARHSMSPTFDADSAYGFTLPSHVPLYQEELQQGGAQATHRANSEYDRQQKQEAFKMLEPYLADLPPAIQAAYRAQAGGFNAVNLPASSLTARLVSTSSPGDSAPPGTMEYGTDRPVDPKAHYRVSHVEGTNESRWQRIDKNTRQVVTESGGIENIDPTQLGKVPGAVAPSMIAPKTITLPGGGTAFTSAEGAANGIAPVATGGINPTLLPNVSDRQTLKASTDANGNPVDVLVNLRSTSGKKLPGAGVGAGGSAASSSAALPSDISMPGSAAAATAAGADRTPEGQKIVTHKGLTPLQNIANEIDVQTLGQTINRLEGVMRNAPLLTSLLSSGKIMLSMEPQTGILKTILKKTVPMSDQEVSLASDFISAMEDINKIRGPLNATGFRGPEAFAAMISQAGDPSANPKVTAGVINNTLQTLRSIRDAKVKGGKAGRTGAASPNTDEQAAIDRLMKKHMAGK